MEWKKNDVIRITIEDISDNGEGIGKTNGFPWFVKDTVIGDEVQAVVMKVKRSYGFARLQKILNPSPARVVPACRVARQCGGCQLQAMNYEEQLRFKENKVRNNLQRIGGLEEPECFPIIGMENPWRYRNKAQYPFGKDKEGRTITGFYAGRTHTIIENDDCLLGAEENRKILFFMKAYMDKYGISPYDEMTHTGLIRHILLRRGFATGELMVCLVINGSVRDLKYKDELVKGLVELFPKEEEDAGDYIASISVSINCSRTNVVMGKEIIDLYGPGYITDYIDNICFHISPLSFYQVNPVQTERLYRTVLEYAGLTGTETVWDLYCGIGTISLFLARKAGQVYGVEIIPQAVEDARANAAQNGFDNVEFYVGKAEEVFPEQYEKNRVRADVVVVDPPRKGCDKACLDTILRMAPSRVIYVSCNSATLARDLKYLCADGYVLEKVQPVDMFPGGVHVETVVLLTQKRKGGYHRALSETQ